MPRFLSKPVIAKNGGDEGGELLLESPVTNTSISTGVTIDVYQNKLRFFEQGGTARGAYIDITATSAGVGTNLLSGGGGGTTIPAGSIQMYAGAITQSVDSSGTVTTTAPSGWLLCDGGVVGTGANGVSRSTYSALFTAISTQFGTGNGSTTFNLPDMRSRMPIGAGTGTGLTSRTLAATGGVETVTLTASQSGLVGHGHANTISASSLGQSVGHTHYQNPVGTTGHSHSYLGGSLAASGTTRSVLSAAGSTASGTIQSNTDTAGGTTSGANSVDHTHSISVSGGVSNVASSDAASSHDNMSPYLAVNFIIKT